MAECVTCGASLGVRRRLSGAKQCETCEQKAKAATTAALAEYDSLLTSILQSPKTLAPTTDRLVQLESIISAGGGNYEDHKLNAYRWHVDQALADEVLSADEEQRLVEVGETLFRTSDAVANVLAPYKSQLFVAMVNDGRLPEIPTSGSWILKKGEVVHLEEQANLLKEVIQREFRGGSRGMSFRVMKGVSYRVGAFRGKMAVVGRSFEVQDTGPLAVTSQRVVFAGTRRTIEIPYSKVVNLNVLSDGIQVSVSNRQTPSTFGISDGPMFAAAINGAMQRLMSG